MSTSTPTTEELTQKRCVPCEGGVPQLDRPQAVAYLANVEGWTLNSEATMIERQWTFANFVEGMAFLNRVAEVAEDEQHHPDVHLTGYRNVAIQIMTHAIGGLSENDFILAAKIDRLD